MVPNRSLVMMLEDLADYEGEVLVNLARNRIYVPRGLVISGEIVAFVRYGASGS